MDSVHSQGKTFITKAHVIESTLKHLCHLVFHGLYGYFAIRMTSKQKMPYIGTGLHCLAYQPGLCHQTSLFPKSCDTVEAHGAHGSKSREIELHALHFQFKLS